MSFNNSASAKGLKPIQSLINPHTRQSFISKKDSTTFDGEGRPVTHGAGGSRNPDCESVSLPLVALIPKNSNLHQTTAERPTIWFYVPYTSEQTPVGEFVLQDEKRNDIFRTDFILPNNSGFVSFTIPSTQAPLILEQEYRWYFKLYCDRDKADSPLFVQGWVKRTLAHEIEDSQLTTTNSLEHIEQAAKENWYDVIDKLVNRRANNFSDPIFEKTWTNFWLKILNTGDIKSILISPEEIENIIKLISQGEILGSVALKNDTILNSLKPISN